MSLVAYLLKLAQSKLTLIMLEPFFLFLPLLSRLILCLPRRLACGPEL